MTKCEEVLRADNLMDHSVQVFEAARLYGRDDLVNRAGEIMAKSLDYLVEKDVLVNAEEKTVIYLLERDDLAVKEVELFDFILKWGKGQVSHTEGDDLLRDKLKQVVPLIRYTNMTPHEFKSLVVPTGLLSAEEIVSVFCYFAEDELVRQTMKIKFNTNTRKLDTKAFVDFYGGKEDTIQRFESTSYCPLRLCTSFQVQVKKKLWSSSAVKKPAITAIKIKLPSRRIQYSTLSDQTLSFSVCVKDCTGPVNDKSVRIRFSKNLLNCKDGEENEIPVEPSVELISGLTYCLIVEDQSKHHAYRPLSYGDVKYTYSGVFSPYDLSSEVEIELGGVADLMLKEIQKDSRLTGFQYSTAGFPINVIRGIKVSLV